MGLGAVLGCCGDMLMCVFVAAQFVVMGGFLMSVFGRSVMCSSREMRIDSRMLCRCRRHGLGLRFLFSGSEAR